MITILKGIVIVVAIFICEIIMILNRLGLGLNGVDCPQRDVLCDGNLIARVDELVVFRFPSAEVFGIFRRKYAGGAAAYILLVIYFFALALNVCDREAVLCGGEERRNRNGAVKLGIYIEQRAVGINPSGGLFREIFKQCLKLFGIRKLCAVQNFNRFKLSVRRGRQVNRSFNNRRLPLCIERNVLCGHRLAGEIIRRAFTVPVFIPTCKHKPFFNIRRSRRRKACIFNAFFVLVIYSFDICFLSTVYKLNPVRITVIIEFCVIISLTILRTANKNKTSNWILVFICDGYLPITKSRILMIQLICFTIVRTGIFSRFIRQQFYIITCCLFIRTICIVCIERSTVKWHGINTRLVCTTVFCGFPSALRFSRPQLADLCTILSGNGLIS